MVSAHFWTWSAEVKCTGLVQESIMLLGLVQVPTECRIGRSLVEVLAESMELELDELEL